MCQRAKARIAGKRRKVTAARLIVNRATLAELGALVIADHVVLGSFWERGDVVALVTGPCNKVGRM